MSSYSNKWPGTNTPRTSVITQSIDQLLYDIDHPLTDVFITDYETIDREERSIARTGFIEGIDCYGTKVMETGTLYSDWFGSRKVHAMIRRLRYKNGTGNVLYKDMKQPITFSVNGCYNSSNQNVTRKIIFHHSPSKKQSLVTIDDLQPTDSSAQDFLTTPDLISISVVLNPRGKTNIINALEQATSMGVNANTETVLVTPEPPSVIDIGIGDSNTYYGKTDRTFQHIPNSHSSVMFNEVVIGDDTMSHSAYFDLNEYNLLSINKLDAIEARLNKILSQTSSVFVSR